MNLFGPTRMLSLGRKSMALPYLMTIQDILGYTSLLISMSLSRFLKYSVKDFKMKKAFVFFLSKVTMELSLKMLSLDHSMKKCYFQQLLLIENT